MAAKGQSKYNSGDILGPNHYKLIERVCHPEKGRRANTRGIFECPEGHRFEACIYHVASGKTKCRECNPNPWFRYKDGTYIGSNGIFLIKRTVKDERGQWYGLMRCHCGKEFEHKIYNIAADIVKSCGCQSNSGQFKRKYQPGDRLGDAQIEFLRYTEEQDSSGNLLAEFQCPYCSNTYITRPSRIVQGEGHTDCGCQETKRRKLVGQKNIKDDLAGQRFGRLTVIKRTNQTARGTGSSYLWECLCDCGTTCYVARSALLSGNTTSCGCKHIEHTINIGKANTKDLSGKMFGYLEPLYQDGTKTLGKTSVHTVATWTCLCHNCETEIHNVASCDLTSGNKISCGCARNSRGEKKIADILDGLGIEYEPFKQFDTCTNPRSGRVLTFDFYLPIQDVIIEFDGKQHYWASETSSWATPENLERTNFRDTVKNDWCEQSGIPLIRIPYTELKKLDAAYISALVETASAERKNVFVPLPDAECDMRPVKF